MSNTNPPDFQLALGASNTGFLLTPSAQLSLQQAAQGGSGTTTFIRNQVASNNFYQWLGELDASAWIPDTDTNGNPVLFAMQKSGVNELVLILNADTSGVYNDINPFTVDGAPYYQVGVLNAVHNYNGTPLWHYTAPIGIATLALKKLIQNYVLDPILAGVAKGFSSACNGAQAIDNPEAVQAGVDNAAYQAADDAGVDGAVVAGDATVSLSVGAAAMTGVVVLTAIPVLINIFAHQTFHLLQIYNLTPYDAVWNIAYQDEGSLVSAPPAADGSSGYTYDLPALIPATSSSAASASSASLGFSSSNDVTGIGFVITVTFYAAGTQNEVAVFNTLFDIPLAGDNSLSMQSSGVDNAKTWYGDNAGASKITQVSASDEGSQIVGNATFDILDGKQPGPNGESMYWYNSVLVSQTFQIP